MLGDRGQLDLDDADRAAVFFAQLVVSSRAPAAPGRMLVRDRDAWLEAAVRVFVAGYRAG
jgi:hypothetical protein